MCTTDKAHACYDSILPLLILNTKVTWHPTVFAKRKLHQSAQQVTRLALENLLHLTLLQFEFSVMGHFTVVSLVAWPLNESEAGVYRVFKKNLLSFLCVNGKKTASLTTEKLDGF